MNEHIPTEVIQLFSAAEAQAYELIPYLYEAAEKQLCCYGKAGRDYAAEIEEIELLYSWQVTVTPLAEAELERGMNLYYRKGNHEGTSINISRMGDANFIQALIEEADTMHSSDIHIEPYENRCRVRMRIDGKLLERYVIDRSNYPALINRIKIISNLDISEKRLPQDGRILVETSEKKFDVRVSILPTIYGEKVVLRLLTRDAGLLDLKKLGLTERQYDDYTRSILRSNGLVLITGPTGSGKSTTLYATLRMLNREDNNILTIEDPVEYTLQGINQVQLKEEIGLTFGSALRTFLRQDPDIIMLGEIRDHDTAQMAIRSSLTGHLMLSTIHTNSAWGSVARLMDMGVQNYLIADTLVACVAQRLVRLLCPHCKAAYTPETSLLKMLQVETSFPFYKAIGCKECFYTGYQGRKAIYEVIKLDEHLSDAIRKNELHIEAYLQKEGITTLKDAALTLLRDGNTSLEEVLPIVNE